MTCSSANNDQIVMTTASALPVKIRPPFDPRAKTLIPGSISSASRTVSGVTSTPTDNAHHPGQSTKPIGTTMHPRLCNQYVPDIQNVRRR
jgi:hypothetical protein